MRMKLPVHYNSSQTHCMLSVMNFSYYINITIKKRLTVWPSDIKTSSWCLWSPNISIREKGSALPSVHSCSFFSFIGMECQWCQSILMHHIPGSMELSVKGGVAWGLRSVLSMTHTQRNRVCECERALKIPKRFICSSETETRWTANVFLWGGVHRTQER